MFTVTHVCGKIFSLDERYPACMKFTKTALIVIDTAIAIGLLAMGILAAYSAAGGNLSAINLLCSLGPTYSAVMVLTSFIPLCINNIAFACIFHFSPKQQPNTPEEAEKTKHKEQSPPSTPPQGDKKKLRNNPFSTPELNQLPLPPPPTPSGPLFTFSPQPPPKL